MLLLLTVIRNENLYLVLIYTETINSNNVGYNLNDLNIFGLVSWERSDNSNSTIGEQDIDSNNPQYLLPPLNMNITNSKKKIKKK
jgi:hypothetical protein